MGAGSMCQLANDCDASADALCAAFVTASKTLFTGGTVSTDVSRVRDCSNCLLCLGGVTSAWPSKGASDATDGFRLEVGGGVQGRNLELSVLPGLTTPPATNSGLPDAGWTTTTTSEAPLATANPRGLLVLELALQVSALHGLLQAPLGLPHGEPFAADVVVPLASPRLCERGVPRRVVHPLLHSGAIGSNVVHAPGPRCEADGAVARGGGDAARGGHARGLVRELLQSAGVARILCGVPRWLPCSPGAPLRAGATAPATVTAGPFLARASCAAAGISGPVPRSHTGTPGERAATLRW
mmetsp:Transcript_41094/g.118192  ORF Transcript_41094/g.118192 Transcript_41094/m.118192 type:complete len:298 (-) Transcript_41094:797-1690(-)